MADLIGARYIPGKRVGSGGTATVFRARDRELGRDVALKMFHPHLVDDPLLRAKVTEEVRLMRGLAHAGIAAVYDLVDEPDVLAIVMEHLPGGDLRRLILQSGALPADTVSSIATQLSQALGYAHSAGVIHRDLKPRNILFTEGGVPKLTDFGLARSASTAGLMENESVAGTAEYTAPETVTSSLWDARSDLYSLGATLFEALTGAPPFTANTPAETLRLQVEGPIPDLPREIQQSAPALAVALTTLLAKDPNARPQTAREFEELLTDPSRPPVRATATAACPTCGAQMSSEYRWCFQCRRPNVSARRAADAGYAVLITGPGKRGEKISPDDRDRCADVAMRHGLNARRVLGSVPRLPFLLSRRLNRGSARLIARDLEELAVEALVVGEGESSSRDARRMLLRKTLTMSPRIYAIALGSMGGIWPAIGNAGIAALPIAAGTILLGIPFITHLSFVRALATVDHPTSSGDGTVMEEMLAHVTDPLIHARVQSIVEAGATLERLTGEDPNVPEDLRSAVYRTVRRARERAASLAMALSHLGSGTHSAQSTLVALPAESPSTEEAVAITRKNDQLANRALEAMGKTALDLHEISVRLARMEHQRVGRELESIRASLQRLDDVNAAWIELTTEASDE